MSSENKYSGLTMKIAITLNLNQMLKHFYTTQRLHVKDTCFLHLLRCEVQTNMYFLLLLGTSTCHKVTKLSSKRINMGRYRPTPVKMYLLNK